MRVPQADDITKIRDIPLAIIDGSDTRNKISKRYDFTLRQALYYLEASQLLGFVTENKGRYSLTPIGQIFVDNAPELRNEILARRMLSVQVIADIVSELIISPTHVLKREELEPIVSKAANISGTTISRRLQTVLTWLWWLGGETGAFEVEGESIRLRVLKKNE